MVHLEGVHRRYSEGEHCRNVLQGVTLRIERGEWVALLGPSGSGKSSLLNIISGIDLPDEGSVHINDHAINRLSERARTLFRRRHIGFVYQFFNLLPTLTVRENVLLPLALNGIRSSERIEEALALVAELGLGDRLESFPDRLSGGEQQRVALARALVHDPDLVLADEPTGNLDSHAGNQVLALMQRLVRKRGHTLLMVTHDSEIARLADRTLILQGGIVRPA